MSTLFKTQKASSMNGLTLLPNHPFTTHKDAIYDIDVAMCYYRKTTFFGYSIFSYQTRCQSNVFLIHFVLQCIQASTGCYVLMFLKLHTTRRTTLCQSNKTNRFLSKWKNLVIGAKTKNFITDNKYLYGTILNIAPCESPIPNRVRLNFGIWLEGLR